MEYLLYIFGFFCVIGVLAQLFGGAEPAEEPPTEEPRGPGFYMNAEDAARNGAHHCMNDHPMDEDGYYI